MIKIGLLEFGLRGPDDPPTTILEDVMNYAIKADRMGFSRFWLTEHHRLSPAWNTPEIILPIIAGLTGNIKIGIAGILMAVHSPYRVALTFKLLNSLFPGRIDLGVANGKPKYPAAQLLSNNRNIREDFRMDFDEKLKELTELLREEDTLTGRGVIITPIQSDIPDIWNMRSSVESASISLKLKVNFSLSLFHNEIDIYRQKEKLASYKEAYFNRYNEQPHINFSFSGVCLKSSQKAENLYKQMGYVASVYPHNCIVGSPALFQDKLLAMQEEFEINEFIFNDLCRDGKERVNTLSMLSRAFELQPQKASV